MVVVLWKEIPICIFLINSGDEVPHNRIWLWFKDSQNSVSKKRRSWNEILKLFQFCRICFLALTAVLIWVEASKDGRVSNLHCQRHPYLQSYCHRQNHCPSHISDIQGGETWVQNSKWKQHRSLQASKWQY